MLEGRLWIVRHCCVGLFQVDEGLVPILLPDMQEAEQIMGRAVCPQCYQAGASVFGGGGIASLDGIGGNLVKLSNRHAERFPEEGREA